MRDFYGNNFANNTCLGRNALRSTVIVYGFLKPFLLDQLWKKNS